MAFLSFPVSPIDGQLYPTLPSVGQNQYQYESATQTWKLLGVATGVTPGCYGDAFAVPSFCVDAQGKITSAVNVAISANTPNLQQVTTQGAVTTDTIDVGGIVAAGLTYPLADGGAGDYLTTDGAGSLGWVTAPTATLQSVTTAGNTTTNSVDVGSLVAAGLTYPVVDGAAGDVLTTDGSGNLGWIDTVELVAAPTTSGDPGSFGQVAIAPGFFYFHDGANWLQIAGNLF